MSRNLISDKQRREAEEFHRPYTPECVALHPRYQPGEPTSPYDQLGVAAWMEEMSKTHEQSRCPHCGRWAIWVENQNIPVLPLTSDSM